MLFNELDRDYTPENQPYAGEDKDRITLAQAWLVLTLAAYVGTVVLALWNEHWVWIVAVATCGVFVSLWAFVKMEGGGR